MLFIKKEQVKHKIIPSKFIAVFLQQIRLKAELVYAESQVWRPSGL